MNDSEIKADPDLKLKLEIFFNHPLLFKGIKTISTDKLSIILDKSTGEITQAVLKKK